MIQPKIWPSEQSSFSLLLFDTMSCCLFPELNRNNWKAGVVLLRCLHSTVNKLCVNAKLQFNELSHPGCFVCTSHFFPLHSCGCSLLNYYLMQSTDSLFRTKLFTKQSESVSLCSGMIPWWATLFFYVQSVCNQRVEYLYYKTFTRESSSRQHLADTYSLGELAMYIKKQLYLLQNAYMSKLSAFWYCGCVKGLVSHVLERNKCQYFIYTIQICDTHKGNNLIQIYISIFFVQKLWRTMPLIRWLW